MFDQVLKTAGKQPLKAKPENYDKLEKCLSYLQIFVLKAS